MNTFFKKILKQLIYIIISASITYFFYLRRDTISKNELDKIKSLSINSKKTIAFISEPFTSIVNTDSIEKPLVTYAKFNYLVDTINYKGSLLTKNSDTLQNKLNLWYQIDNPENYSLTNPIVKYNYLKTQRIGTPIWSILFTGIFGFITLVLVFGIKTIIINSIVGFIKK